METSNGKVSDIEESLKKLSSSSKNVIGGFVMTLEGEMIKSTLDPATTSQVSDQSEYSGQWSRAMIWRW